MNNKSGSESEIPWLKPCGHEPPQGASQLHGVCLFCYRDRLAHLQKLCEEQKGEIERLKNSVPGSVKSYIAQIEHLNRKVEALEWAIGEWKKEEVLWKEREANLNSEVDRQTEKLCYENAALQSQLATQTERLRVMREALELAIDAFEKFQPDEGSRYHDVWMEAEQALNQDSLGDGK